MQLQFWKKYKAKKELKQKLEKARFINFYGHKIDLSLGQIIKTICLDNTITTIALFNNKFNTINCYITLKYENFLEISLFIGENMGSIRDKYCLELNDFLESGKFTERLNEYNKLKKEYELL